MIYCVHVYAKQCDSVGITGRRGLCDMPRLGDIVAPVYSARGLNTDKYERTQPLPKVQAPTCCTPVCQDSAPNHVYVL